MSCVLPPGFRFHPTDEELIIYYLRTQVTSRPCPVPFIPEVNIYKFDPWELPGKSDSCEGEWYFFSPRHRKYPNGVRPNRATASGYWKATGTDKAIYSGSRYVGVKKALVFYRGRPPRGSKTEWIMHEYRLGDRCRESAKQAGSMRALDEWALYRIYKKKQQRSAVDRPEDSPTQEISATEVSDSEEKAPVLPRSCSLALLLESDYISASQLFSDDPFGSIDDIFDGSGSSDAALKVIGNQSVVFNRPTFVDPIFQH